MRIVCVGGGPAGLYFAILTKLADPDHEVTVLERNPAGVTYGWGVTVSDGLLDDLFRCDPVSARDIWNSAAKWDEYEVRAAGKPTTFLGGYGFSLGRRRLLSILTARATNLGVDLRTLEVEDLSMFDDADLVVACDGANSRIRAAARRCLRDERRRRPQQVHLAGHARGLRHFHLRVRGDRGRLDLVPRLPVHR